MEPKLEWDDNRLPVEEAIVGVREHMKGGTHYLKTKLQPWDVMLDWLHPDAEPFEAYLIGNVLKYLQRYRRKGKPYEDLQKAKHYLERTLEELG